MSFVHIKPYNDTKSISDYIPNFKYDYEFEKDLYEPYDSYSLKIYDEVRKYYSVFTDNKTIKITFTDNNSFSGSTIAGISEKFMYDEPVNDTTSCYKTDVKIIYISTSADLNVNNINSYIDFNNCVLSDVLGLTEQSYTYNRIKIDPKNIFLIGTDEKHLDKETLNIITTEQINMYSLQKLRKFGITNVLDEINNKCKGYTVHIAIDMSCIHKNYLKSVYRTDTFDDGFDIDEIRLVIHNLINLDVHSIDISNYNFDNTRTDNMICIFIMFSILNYFTDCKKYIENLDKQVLIVNDINNDNDNNLSNGWKIYKNDDNTDMILSQFDKINNIVVYNNKLYAITTVEEQLFEKNIYDTIYYTDCCLIPLDKIILLLNFI